MVFYSHFLSFHLMTALTTKLRLQCQIVEVCATQRICGCARSPGIARGGFRGTFDRYDLYMVGNIEESCREFQTLIKATTPESDIILYNHGILERQHVLCGTLFPLHTDTEKKSISLLCKGKLRLDGEKGKQV